MKIAEQCRSRVLVSDRGDVGFDRLRGDDADDAERPRGIEKLGVAGATDLLILIAEEEERPAFPWSRGQLRAGVDGLEEAFLAEEIDDACGGLEALARDIT